MSWIVCLKGTFSLIGFDPKAWIIFLSRLKKVSNTPFSYAQIIEKTKTANFRPQILTFDDKRKRAKLVVISAKKLGVDHKNVASDDVDDASDDVNDDDDDAPLGNTVQRESNGRGRVLCTRLWIASHCLMQLLNCWTVQLLKC